MADDTGVLDEHRLRQLIEVGRSLVAELDQEAVMNRALEVACELTGARYAALGVLAANRVDLERFITRESMSRPGPSSEPCHGAGACSACRSRTRCR
ncbi:MAG: hypothetical protein H0X42_07280 [Solirubrobacterales bacterium]|nr:hypothetical protein [Solirubrobacterales bacterium]